MSRLIPVSPPCLMLDAYAFLMGGFCLFWPEPIMQIVASFFFAAFVTFFVARMICEDQTLSDADMEILVWHMQRFPSLQKIHDEISGSARSDCVSGEPGQPARPASKSRLRYHDLHTLESAWRRFIHHEAPHKDDF